ncbi:MAG: DUF47 domain-containing protein [Bacteroidota bacterium]
MKFSLLPKEFEFFDLFDTLGRHIETVIARFQEIIDKGSVTDEDVQSIREIEHTADNVTHEIIDKLNKTFITPFDREDIHVLAHELDGVIDIILKMSNLMRIYKISGIDKKFIEVVGLINSSGAALAQAVKGLRDFKNSKPIIDNCIEVNRLENVGDHLRNEVIGELFSNNNDAIYIMKWKDIFQNAEKVLDQCERVAKTIEAILVKQA